MKNIFTKILFVAVSSLALNVFFATPAFALIKPPTNVVATPGNGKVTLTFNPSVATNGDVVTGYIAFTYGNDSDLHGYFFEGKSLSSPIIVEVPNGNTYRFQVYATGTHYSGNSSFSNSVRPSDMYKEEVKTLVPSAPTGVTVVKGTYGNATVSFSPSIPASSSAGSKIKFYSLRATPSLGYFPNNTSSPIQLSGLTNGTSYQFEVRAQDSDGFWGPYSKITSPMVLKWEGESLVPNAPTGVTVSKGAYGKAIINFTPSVPASSSDGSKISFYSVRTTPSVGNFPNSTSSPITVTGLENNKTYQFEVRARDSDGFWSPYSKITSPLLFKWDIPSLVPNPPTNIVAKPGDKSVEISFTPSVPASSSDGSKIRFYSIKVTPDIGSFPNGEGSPIKITGLKNGTPYTFEVRANDSDGFWSPYAKATSPVAPAGVPDVPQNVRATAGNQSATITLVPPESDGGSPITGYSVVVVSEGLTDRTAEFKNAKSLTVTQLDNDVEVMFRIAAVNKHGIGPYALSNPVTPASSEDIGGNIEVGDKDPVDTDPSEVSRHFQLENPLKSSSFEEFLAKILDALVLILTPILVLMLVLCGFLFVKAQGNAEQLGVAKKALLGTLIGSTLVLGAHVISNLLENTFTQF